MVVSQVRNGSYRGDNTTRVSVGKPVARNLVCRPFTVLNPHRKALNRVPDAGKKQEGVEPGSMPELGH